MQQYRYTGFVAYYKRNALAAGYVVGCVYLTQNNVVVYTGTWQGAINYVKGLFN
jgi:hypothetical protein